jgi:phosphatidylinositol 4-kinase
VIIKSYDDLRQESFAMQLLQEFDKIFKIERLQVRLLPYEVLPLSHEAGIMECVRDAITIDELKRKGKTLLGVLDSRTKRKNFIHTLTAYSLVTYFLQVKDRHNGNIMIRKDGCIFHIDYGFFMSNLPGKGV